MKQILVLLLFLLSLLALLEHSLSAIIKTSRPIDGEYIIELSRGVNLRSFIRSKSFSTKSGEVETLEQRIMQVYERSLNGFSARLSDEQVLELEGIPEVMRISANGRTKFAKYVTNDDAPWNLGRLSSWWSLPSSGPYSYSYDDSAGSNVNCYIIDTGIYDGHSEFQDGLDRVIHMGLSGLTTGDTDGHGTAVASLVGGMTCGVANKVWLLDVKVCESSDSVAYSDILSGIEIALNDCWDTYIFKSCVMVLPLDPMDAYDALDSAVTTAYLEYCAVVVVPAGNSGTDTTCTLSPTRAPYSMVVAASDITDYIWDYSNYGRCVDFVSPGVGVQMADISCSDCITTGTGTSFATALAAGLLAYFIQLNEICLCDEAWYTFWYYANWDVYMPWYPLFNAPLALNEYYWTYRRDSEMMGEWMRSVNETQRFASKNITAVDKARLRKEIRLFMGRHRNLPQQMSNNFD